MHVHTELTASDLRAILRETVGPRGVYFDDDRVNNLVNESRSRKRARKLTFYLVASDGYGRRYANSGNSGAGHYKAATYDEWGVFLAKVFERDPDAICGVWRDITHFESESGHTVDEWLSLPLPNYDGKVAA